MISPRILRTARSLCKSACRIVRLYACLAAGVSPEGSQVDWADPHANAIAGAAISTIRGRKRDKTRQTVSAPLAIAEIMNGWTLLDSSISAPCQVANIACPMHEVTAITNAKDRLTELIPE